MKQKNLNENFSWSNFKKEEPRDESRERKQHDDELLEYSSNTKKRKKMNAISGEELTPGLRDKENNPMQLKGKNGQLPSKLKNN